MSDFDLSGYLQRLGSPQVAPTLAGLSALQQAQLMAIPFETLDAFLGQTPDLALEVVQDKLIRRGRGGYCFELNGLFGAALDALGFSVERRLARVRNGAARGGVRSHLLFLVTVEGQVSLADAGFGGPGALISLALNGGAPQDAPNGRYRIVFERAAGEHVVQRLVREDWVSLYGFDDVPVRDIDVVAANHLCATWPGAPFPDNLMISRYDADGRIGVFNRAVTEQHRGQETRRSLAEFDEFAALLTGRVGLQADPDLLRAAWKKLTDAAAPDGAA